MLSLIGLPLVPGRVGAEVFDRGAIAARTRFGNDHAIERLVHGTNLGKTDFESHVRCFAELFFSEKLRTRPARPYPVKP